MFSNKLKRESIKLNPDMPSQGWSSKMETDIRRTTESEEKSENDVQKEIITSDIEEPSTLCTNEKDH